jgi:hypothetical protein
MRSTGFRWLQLSKLDGEGKRSSAPEQFAAQVEELREEMALEEDQWRPAILIGRLPKMDWVIAELLISTVSRQ